MSDSEERAEGGFSLGDLSASGYDSQLQQPAEGPIALPRTALLSFRKSGGMRFSSRGAVIYRDGWVAPVGEGLRWRHLGDGDLDRLAHLALRARLGRRRPARQQPPDGYAYEIAARVGGRVRRAEVMTGAVPAEMRPLISALEALL